MGIRVRWTNDGEFWTSPVQQRDKYWETRIAVQET